MISLRYKPMKSGKFSIYLDIYVEDDKGKKKREYEFLRIHVTKDYSKTKKVTEIDRELMILANNIRSKRELELFGKVSELEKLPKRTNISFIKFVEKTYNKTHRGIEQTLLSHLRKFSKGKDILFSDITLNWIEKFREHLLKTMCHNTMRANLKLIKTFFNKAIMQDMITYNPFDKFEIPKKQEVDRLALDLTEIKLLMDTPVIFNIQAKQAFLFACFTGLRFSDIENLRLDNFKTEKDKDGNEHKVIIIKPIKTENVSGRTLNLPLSEQALKMLDEIERNDGSELVFDNLPQRSYFGKCLKLWGAQAGVKKRIHFHMARHTFATMALSHGIDIYTVSKLLGHASVKESEIYTKVEDDKKVQEVKKFPEFAISD